MEAERGEGGGRILGRPGRPEGDRHRPFPVPKKGFKTVGVIVARDKAQQLQVIAREHDAVIRRLLSEMAAARGQGKAEPGPAHAGAFEVAHADDDVVDAGNPVAHCVPVSLTDRFNHRGTATAVIASEARNLLRHTGPGVSAYRLPGRSRPEGGSVMHARSFRALLPPMPSLSE